MKVYKLRFNSFAKSNSRYSQEWKELVVKIYARNKFELIRTFLIETKNINSNIKTQKQLWDEVKHKITYEELKFPIVEYFNP
jgi:hypothetical protein